MMWWRTSAKLRETRRVRPRAVGLEHPSLVRCTSVLGHRQMEPHSLGAADLASAIRQGRAYQRKVAVAEFDAVVSGDIYVLAPQNDRLLPELLPFICLSERFFSMP